ncbi:MAG: TMEM165/GDT1 family protein [Pseudomonadota bacterium]|nr:TMEM165/GDT1 family protein [Pseudomonadota bacterium]
MFDITTFSASPFLASTVAVAIAEVGDKTQLLSLLLVARFRNKWAIIGGILLATLLNHGLSSWGGIWLGENMDSWLSGRVADYVLAGSFALMALWVLIPDKEDDDDDNFAKYGAFIATTLLFFIAEVGDKTQIAAVILAAEFQSFFWVTAGTTLGMLIANAPVVIWGQWLMDRLPLDLARRLTAVVFLSLAAYTLFSS